VVSTHQRDWDERLPIFLLAYRASTHDTTGMTPANMVFGTEHRLPCDLLFGAPPDKEQSTTDYVADMVERLHDTHHYAWRHLRVASDRMKARYDCLANSAGFQEGDRVWLYRPTRTRGRSPKLQPAWEGPYKVITRINVVVHSLLSSELDSPVHLKNSLLSPRHIHSHTFCLDCWLEASVSLLRS
jgi:hypothetical protein